MSRREDSVRLGFDSCEAMLGKLEREGQRLLQSWSADDAMNFCLTAHHLHFDWVDKLGSNEMQARRSVLDTHPSGARKIIQTTYDISNGSKHVVLTHKSSMINRVLDETDVTVIADWHSYFNAPPYNYETSVFGLRHDSFVRQVVGYLSWIIRGPGSVVPQPLIDEIQTLRKP